MSLYALHGLAFAAVAVLTVLLIAYLRKPPKDV